MSNSSFGAPKPLAGQEGYNLSETQRLEQESREMEHRLMLLKERMQRDQQERETYKAGTKWGSARADKGSLTSYSKDVHDKHKKRVASEGSDPVLKLMMEQAAAAQRQAQLEFEETKGKQSKKAQVPFKPLKASEMTSSRSTVLASISSKGGAVGQFLRDDTSLKTSMHEKSRSKQSAMQIESWGVEQVGQWLESLGLEQYVPVFDQNDIKGNVLLDLSLEDLDYMSITVLGHRKAILKGIEALKMGGAPKLSAIPTGGAPKVVESLQASKKIHWSHTEPLSSKKISDRQDVVANSADYLSSSEKLDEDAERAAFTQAVMEWRNSGKSDSSSSKAVVNPSVVKPSEEYDVRAITDNYLSASDPLDEEAERAAFTQAVMEWRNSGKAKTEENPVVFGPKSKSEPKVSGLWHNPFLAESFSGSGQATPPLSARGLPSLAEGTFDEAKEHEEFAKAVESWRRGKPNNVEEKLKSVADKISEDLDEEFRINKQRLEKEQQAILEKIAEANRQKEEERIDATFQALPDDLLLQDSDDDVDDHTFSRYVGVGSDKDDFSDVNNDERKDYEEDSSKFTPRTPRIPELQLLESRLGVDESLRQFGAEQENSPGGYYVDEESDDDS